MEARRDVVCDLVLPCRDEARALTGLLAEVPAGFRVVVVDNGSRDGAAVHAGLLSATADLVAFMDGDGSFTGRHGHPPPDRQAAAADGRRPVVI